MAIKNAFNSFTNAGKYAVLHHRHTEFDHYNDFDDICPFLEIKFVWDSKIYNALCGYFSACKIIFVYSFRDCKTQAAKITSDWSSCAIELKIRIDVTLAPVTPEWGCHLNSMHLLTCKRSYPYSQRIGCLLDLAVQDCTWTSDEAWINFSVFWFV